MKTIIIYGSTTGNAKSTALAIGRGFKESKVVDVSEFNFDELENYDLLIFGTSTAGFGDLQDEWEDNINKLDNIDLSKKNIAIFGTGDQLGYPDSFAGSLSYIYEKVLSKGARVIGKTSTEGYNFKYSASVIDDKFVGLVIDDENQVNLTDQRIKDWVVQLVEELG